MTPLFPIDETPILIEQGATGDCFLLAALDSILASGPEGLATLKAMFSETESGVTVHIKRTGQSKFLQVGKLRMKYRYTYDDATDTDVFFLTKERLRKIDTTTSGAKTNSLAVKILEHLCAYYYIYDWDSNHSSSSLLAHDPPSPSLEKDSFSETTSKFTGQFLGVATYDCLGIEEAIKIKTINPKQAMSVFMRTGKSGRHAWRVESIQPSPPHQPGKYTFLLVNPWNNQRQEIHTSSDVQRNGGQFCIYNANQKKHDLTLMLLQLPEKIGIYVFEHADLLEFLLYARELTPTITPADLETYVILHQELKGLSIFVNLLASPGQGQIILDCIRRGATNTQIMYLELLKQIPDLDFVIELIRNVPSRYLTRCYPILADRAIMNRDATLYKYLSRLGFDFLTHISRNPIYSEAPLLNNLIHLECTHSPANIPRLIKLADYIQRATAHNPLPPGVHLWHQEIYDFVLQKAIKEESKRFDLGVKVAENRIISSLAHYYFHQNPSKLTTSGNLHFLFHTKVIPTSHIVDHFVLNERLFTHAILFAMSQKDTLAGSLKTYIRTNDSDITEKTIDTIMLNHRFDTPRDLLYGFFMISLMNTKLATKLFQMLVRTTSSLFSIDTPIAEVMTEKDSPFKTWVRSQSKLYKNTSTLQNPMANTLALSCIEQINALPISFDGITTAHIKAHRLRLILQVHGVFEAYKERISHESLQDQSHPDIDRAVKDKIQEIRSAALRQQGKPQPHLARSYHACLFHTNTSVSREKPPTFLLPTPHGY